MEGKLALHKEPVGPEISDKETIHSDNQSGRQTKGCDSFRRQDMFIRIHLHFLYDFFIAIGK
jgi:hypothetical protein